MQKLVTPNLLLCSLLFLLSFFIPLFFLFVAIQKLVEYLPLKVIHYTHTPAAGEAKTKVTSIGYNTAFNLFCSWKWALMDSPHLLIVAILSASLSCRKLSSYIRNEWLFFWQCPTFVSFAYLFMLTFIRQLFSSLSMINVFIRRQFEWSKC